MSNESSTVRRHRASKRLPRWARLAVWAMLAAVVVTTVTFTWTQIAAAGHLHELADAPRADVVLVLGAQVAPGGMEPMPFLRGRLNTAADLLERRKAKVILVSGDANGGSGDETRVMGVYLTLVRGVESARVVADPAGLDTYDSCVRAKEVFGVTRALIVTQSYHLARAVALCRSVGIDAAGVRARCDDCRTQTMVQNTMRDFIACDKAALDALVSRGATVESPPSTAVSDALNRV